MQFTESLCTSAFVGHRATGIEKDVTSQICLFLVFPNVEAIAFFVNFPVEVTNLISGNILAVLLEFDAEPLVG